MSKQAVFPAKYAIICALSLIFLARANPRSEDFTRKAMANGLSQKIGDCSVTRIKEISTRLINDATGAMIPGSGSAVSFRNGGYQVSYEDEEEISRSRVGDRVRMCLVTIPEGCPLGDTRGFRYTTTNLRTGENWTLPDSPHSCGGA
jgi:hypothetical protein